jgi:hypothetical protein
MTTNDITGDKLRSRPNSKAFNDNFDAIFNNTKPHEVDDDAVQDDDSDSEEDL